MTDYKKLLKELRQHRCPASEEDTEDFCETCAYDIIVEDSTSRHGIRDVCVCGTMARAADAIAELLRAASAMHKWIFLNAADEQAAYDECGLSPDVIDAVPAADVAPVRHGRWIKTIGENGVTSACCCNLCGFEDSRFSLFSYCPICGARMDDAEPPKEET